MKVVGKDTDQYREWVGIRFVCVRNKKVYEVEKTDLKKIKTVNFPSYENRHKALRCPNCGALVLLNRDFRNSRPYLSHH